MEIKDLYNSIVEGVLSKKAKEVIEINLSDLDYFLCNYFIICHGDSNTQVKAIAESVEKNVKESLKLPAWHKEGLNNCQWVLLDYTDIVVHIFQKEFRDYYNLEEFWAHGRIQKIEDVKV